MNEYYPTLLEMMPWHKKYPVTVIDAWAVFRGPQLNTIVPDVYVVHRSNEPKVSLHHLLASDKRLFVLIFDGISHGDTTQESRDLAEELKKNFPDVLECFVVTRYYESKIYDPIDNILGDIDLSVHEKFGAKGQCIYVIDKNKTLVRKSSGFIKDKLYFYLKSL